MGAAPLLLDQHGKALVLSQQPRRAIRSQIQGRFDAAQTTADNRRHWGASDALSADAAANPTVRRTLRQRARYEVANNSYARGIVNTLAKDQFGIERNFSFLKDPLIVNDIFLKKPERIEALGAILLIALLVSNLIEFVLRQHVKAPRTTLPGWDGKQTKKPTAFMMRTKFAGIIVVRAGNLRSFGRPLNPVQTRYLDALGVSPHEFSGRSRSRHKWSGNSRAAPPGGWGMCVTTTLPRPSVFTRYSAKSWCATGSRPKSDRQPRSPMGTARRAWMKLFQKLVS